MDSAFRFYAGRGYKGIAGGCGTGCGTAGCGGTGGGCSNCGGGGCGGGCGGGGCVSVLVHAEQTSVLKILIGIIGDSRTLQSGQGRLCRRFELLGGSPLCTLDELHAIQGGGTIYSGQFTVGSIYDCVVLQLEGRSQACLTLSMRYRISFSLTWIKPC